MIVCSKALVAEEKWQREMRRFDEEFVALDGPTLRHCLAETDRDGVWPDRFSRTIVPYSLFNETFLFGAEGGRGQPRLKGLATLDPPPQLDLLIVDEAHNARNADTYLHRGLKILADNAEAVVFLTATPVQLESSDLFTLLNLLRPDLVIDRHTFAQMAEPNPFINEAVAATRAAGTGWEERAAKALAQAAATPWGRAVLAGNPEFQSVCAMLTADHIDREARVKLVHRIEGLHSFASVINRTRRRDIGAFTTRKPTTIAVEFTPEQAQLHTALLDVQARILRHVHGEAPIAFLMSTMRRQAASCLHGLAPYLEAVLDRRLSQLEAVEIDGEFPELPTDRLETIRSDIEAVLADARRLPPADPKLEHLIDIIEDKDALPNNKLLVFSSFRHTLAYLETHLQRTGKRVGVVHGDVPEDRRRELRRAFALPKEDAEALDVLLSSEVGSEGLDYQFCDALVNYDIPWNPMRIEQRIGRIDRYGQRSETVAIYNLVTPGTIDFDIYLRCLMRIGVFEQAIGGNEEILGTISRELHRVADDLSLSPLEREARLQQLADNEIRLMAEQQMLEERQAELFGVRLASDAIAREVADASSFWLEPEALQRLVSVYLGQMIESERSPLLGQGVVKTLRLSSEARRALLPERRRGQAPLSLVAREWENWLRGPSPSLTVTFDREAAAADRSVTFITPTHPLVQQAARALTSSDQPVRTALKVTSSSHRPGRYTFAVYHWRFRGIREDSELVPVLEDALIARDFTALLRSAQPLSLDAAGFPSQHMFDDLDAWHFDLWQTRRTRHAAETAEMARFRRESLATSHRARMAVLSEQLAAASDDRIQRMRTAQLALAEADYNHKATQLAEAERSSDVTFRSVAFGILEVEHIND